MTTLQNRQPAGVPTGGQFATTARPESGVSLGSSATAPDHDHAQAGLDATLDEVTAYARGLAINIRPGHDALGWALRQQVRAQAKTVEMTFPGPEGDALRQAHADLTEATAADSAHRATKKPVHPAEWCADAKGDRLTHRVQGALDDLKAARKAAGLLHPDDLFNETAKKAHR